MATFITNIKFTQQGIKDIAHSPKRAAIFKTEAKKFGAKVKEIYWTLGDHDGLVILEAPDEETATLHRRRDGEDRGEGAWGMSIALGWIGHPISFFSGDQIGR